MLTTCLYADQSSSKALREYKIELDALASQAQAAVKRSQIVFDKEVEKIRGVFEEEMEKLRRRALRDLQAELDAALGARELDEAVALREAIKEFEKGGQNFSKLVSINQPKKQIPPKALKFKGHSYSIQTIPMYPNVAADYASSLGGHLLRIESAEEWGFVKKWLSGKQFLLIGGSDQITDGQWLYSDGTRIDFSQFPKAATSADNHFLAFHEDVIGAVGFERRPFVIEWDD